MKDKQFGQLKWTDSEVWETSVTLGDFRTFGELTYAGDENEDGGNSLAPDTLYRDGRFLLIIDTAGQRKAPAQPQRHAWESFLANAGRIAEDMLASFLTNYQLQRPARVKWWKAIYGDEPY